MPVKLHLPLDELKRLERAEKNAERTRRLRVYFQDESRFGQQGTTTNVWAQRGSRSRVTSLVGRSTDGG